MTKTARAAPYWLIAAAALAAILALPLSCRTSAETCSQCGRSGCTNLAFTIQLESGKAVQTCCPRCGLHYIATEHPAVAALTARDFDSKAPIDARHAFYVDGSDVTPCHSVDASAPKDERGCCLTPDYDRCLPSLLAFGTREKAEEFARSHGGDVKTFQDLKAPAG